MKQKVFCIGFHKTGTSSLKAALETLGYRVTGPNGVHDPDIAENVHDMAHALVARYDAFQDNPWPIIFREMDAAYPGSRFILSVRDPESWIESQVRHFGTQETPMRKWIYGVGCPEGNEQTYISRFDSHNRTVMRHFADRPEDLLVVNLIRGDGWQPLCEFLGRDIPQEPFPHANRAASRSRRTRRAADLLRRVGSSLIDRVR